MEHRGQTAYEYVLHTMAVETDKNRFRLECGHVSLFVADKWTGGPELEIQTQERRVRREALLRRPAESLDDQAAIVRLLVLLLAERTPQGVGVDHAFHRGILL